MSVTAQIKSALDDLSDMPSNFESEAEGRQVLVIEEVAERLNGEIRRLKHHY
jgi:hypothetical protein